MEYLVSLEEHLCAKTGCTDFEAMFKVIVANSHEGKNATAKDIFDAQTELKKSLHSIESALTTRSSQRRPSSPQAEEAAAPTRIVGPDVVDGRG